MIPIDCKIINFLYTCIYTFVAKPKKYAKMKHKMDTSKSGGGAPIFKEETNDIKLVAMHLGATSADENYGVLVSEVVKHIKKGNPNPWSA